MFKFFGKKPAPVLEEPIVEQAWQEAVRGVRFIGLTEDRIVEGDLAIDERLSDLLNRRDPIAISNALESSFADPTPVALASERSEIDPYEFLIVFAAAGSTPEHGRSRQMAHRVRKVPREAVLSVPPFEVVGTIHLYPDVAVADVLGRAHELFLPVTTAAVYLGSQLLGVTAIDTVLVNRHQLSAAREYGALIELPGELAREPAPAEATAQA